MISIRSLFRRPAAAEHPLLVELKRDGIVLCPEYFDAETVSTFRDEVDRCQAEYPSLVVAASGGADRRLFGIDRLSPTIREGFHDLQALRSLGQSYMCSRNERGFTLAGKITALEGNLGSGEGWHRDSNSRAQFKALVYLSDVGPDNGPFEYFHASHTKSALRVAASTVGPELTAMRIADDVATAFERALGKHYPRRTVTGRAGDLVLVDTRGVHRGAPLRTGTRYALTRYAWYRGKIPKHVRGLLPENRLGPGARPA